jgi:hypothetical protein
MEADSLAELVRMAARHPIESHHIRASTEQSVGSGDADVRGRSDSPAWLIVTGLRLVTESQSARRSTR